MSSFFLQNFGCRATQADGGVIERQLINQGFSHTPTPATANLAVLNTCTVTASADQDVRSAIRRIHRQNPDCKILVTGCYAQRAPDEIAAIPGVSWVVGNSHKQQIGDFVDQTKPGNFVSLEALSGASQPTVIVGDIFAHTHLLAAPVFEVGTGWERTRPNLKVQDGCNNRCSFCIIPSVRGNSRSLSMREAIAQVNELVSAGYREVVISGINLGRWGRDLPTSSKFPQLVRSILENSSLEKLRISSVEPMDWSDELIQLVASSPRIAKHAHVPLQSGSDRILRLMHRKYRPWHYAEKITTIREAMPDAAIGADVMVGFPGESDSDFEESKAFIQSLPFTYLHVFTYSSRPGTPSAAMPNQVPVSVARERNQILRDLAGAKKSEFLHSFVGRSISAITLQTNGQNPTEALTDNYLKLQLQGPQASNQWISASIFGVSGEFLLGTVDSAKSLQIPACQSIVVTPPSLQML